MKNMIRVFGIIFLVAFVGFSFTACEGPTGPAGKDGIDGQNGQQGPAGKDGIDGQNGQQGPAGPDGTFEVWDSSSPSKKLGIFIGSLTEYVGVVTTNGYIVQLSWSTAQAANPAAIYFTDANQTGDPLTTLVRPTNYYAFNNPHSGGTWYLYAENAFANPVTGYSSSYSSTGTAFDTSNTSITCYKLRVTTPTELGIPEGITPPLVLRVVE